MNSERLIREQFEKIHILSYQMLQSVKEKPDMKRFYELFAERTNLFEEVNVSIQVDHKTAELIQEILKIDKEIEEVLKTYQKEIANEQIRLIHAKRTLGQKENRYESYIDYKK